MLVLVVEERGALHREGARPPNAQLLQLGDDHVHQLGTNTVRFDISRG